MKGHMVSMSTISRPNVEYVELIEQSKAEKIKEERRKKEEKERKQKEIQKITEGATKPKKEDVTTHAPEATKDLKEVEEEEKDVAKEDLALVDSIVSGKEPLV